MRLSEQFCHASTRCALNDDTQRANTASEISVSGMPKSSALMPVHLPVPLAGGVEDFFHQRLAVFIFEAQNIGGDLNQIAVELGGVPKLENLVHFIIAQPQPSFINA